MTIGKFVRIIALCLLFELLCAPLSSCAMPSEDCPPDLLADHSDEINEIQYRVVISHKCSAQLLGAANELAVKLTEKTGVRCLVVYDTQKNGSEGNVTEVILGETNREEASSLLNHLKKDDYLCRVAEGSVVIGGKTDQATVAAIQRFCLELLPAATAELLLSEGGGFLYQASYPYSAVTLNGFDLNDYQIVYPNGASEGLIRLGNALRERIADKSGYVLKVSSQSEYGNVGKGIFLAEDGSDEAGVPAYLIPTAEGISLCGGDALGVSAAMREFFSILFAANEGGVCAAVLSATKACPYDRTVSRLASVISDHWLPNGSLLTVTNMLYSISSEYVPDAVLFGEMPKDQAQYIKDGLYGYEYLEQPLTNDTVLPIGQKTSKLSALESQLNGEGTPVVSVCRVGSERDGFLLVRLSGLVTKDSLIRLPRSMTESSLPVVILAHVTEKGGTLSLADLETNGICSMMSETYEVDGMRYTVSCYATENAFSIVWGTKNNTVGYREIVVERLSLFN